MWQSVCEHSSVCFFFEGCFHSSSLKDLVFLFGCVKTLSVLEMKIPLGTSRWSRLHASTAGGEDRVPAWGAEAPHAMARPAREAATGRDARAPAVRGSESGATGRLEQQQQQRPALSRGSHSPLAATCPLGQAVLCLFAEVSTSVHISMLLLWQEKTFRWTRVCLFRFQSTPWKSPPYGLTELGGFLLHSTPTEWVYSSFFQFSVGYLGYF